MTLLVNVQGGTRAGVRRIKQPAKPWTHKCIQAPGVTVSVTLDATHRRCPACGTGRPA